MQASRILSQWKPWQFLIYTNTLAKEVILIFFKYCRYWKFLWYYLTIVPLHSLANAWNLGDPAMHLGLSSIVHLELGSLIGRLFQAFPESMISQTSWCKEGPLRALNINSFRCPNRLQCIRNLMCCCCCNVDLRITQIYRILQGPKAVQIVAVLPFNLLHSYYFIIISIPQCTLQPT